jgi:hypothetical protein
MHALAPPGSRRTIRTWRLQRPQVRRQGREYSLSDAGWAIQGARDPRNRLAGKVEGWSTESREEKGADNSEVDGKGNPEHLRSSGRTPLRSESKALDRPHRSWSMRDRETGRDLKRARPCLLLGPVSGPPPHHPQPDARIAPGKYRRTIDSLVAPDRAIASAPCWHMPAPCPCPRPTKVTVAPSMRGSTAAE